jgi:hypothetical protein
MAGGLDDYLRRYVTKMRSLLPDYLPLGADGYDRLAVSARWNLGDLLDWLRREHPPEVGELDSHRREFARGARAGLAVTDVLRSLRVGFQEFWLELAARAARRGDEASAGMQLLTERLWAAHDLLATVATEAHLAETREIDLARQRELLDFWALISRLPARLPAAESAARRLGVDPAATFLAWAHDDASPPRRPHPEPGTYAVHLRDEVVGFAALGPTEGPSAGVPGARATVVDGERRIEHLRNVHDGPLGVGLPRAGLTGLAQSAADARRALAVARRRAEPVATFADSWLPALALDDELGLAPLLAPVDAALRADPSLIRPVETFLRHQRRLRPTARALQVHPNTLAYRLQRFSAAAGVDLTTVSGSLLAALALVRAGARPEAPEPLSPPA